MESYRELRDRQQKEFNELPLGFAFSMEQFRGMMEEWGLDPEKDQDKLYRIPGGGFIQVIPGIRLMIFTFPLRFVAISAYAKSGKPSHFSPVFRLFTASAYYYAFILIHT